MSVILPIVSVTTGYAAGVLFSVKAAEEFGRACRLYDTVTLLKTEICVYNSGLCKAIVNTGMLEKSEGLREIYGLLKQNSVEPVKKAICSYGFPKEIQLSLTRLLETLLLQSEDEIRLAFDSTVTVIAEFRSKAEEKARKDAPLYRKIGIIGGIAIAVLLI